MLSGSRRADVRAAVFYHPSFTDHAPEEAQDLTQTFFGRFLEKNYLKDVARERGRFRSFLLAALRQPEADGTVVGSLVLHSADGETRSPTNTAADFGCTSTPGRIRGPT
jgi:hypothetical protein